MNVIATHLQTDKRDGRELLIFQNDFIQPLRQFHSSRNEMLAAAHRRTGIQHTLAVDEQEYGAVCSDGEYCSFR